MNPLADLLRRTGLTDPGRTFLTTPGGERWTYDDLETRSARLAGLLVSLGVRPGDRVAVQTRKVPDVLALHVACARAGAVHLPMNDAYTDAEVQFLVDDADPALVVRDTPVDHRPSVPLAELVALAGSFPRTFADVDRGDDDPAGMLYTSGTTGTPKGAVLSHRNLVFHAETMARVWAFTPDDVLVHVLPLFHAHGLFVAAHCTLASGSSMVLHERFDPAVVVGDLERATVFMGVPTHYTRLLDHPGFAAGNVRLFASGSAPMLLATHLEVQARTGQTVLERYGMSECCILASNPLDGVRKPGTVGPALPGVEIRVTGELGQVEVRGPNVFTGYWRRPDVEAFTADGWFVTGDLGRLDDEGYLEIVGRSKDMVISGGLNVYPKEVELALDELAGVAESAVVGLPHPDFGEAVVAVVVLEPGATLEPDEIRAAVRTRLASYKVPKRVVLVDALPRNTMGKVQKNVLRADLLGATTV